MAYFKRVTTEVTPPNIQKNGSSVLDAPPTAAHQQQQQHQNAVIMGRRTWESIPSRFRPLPSRLNIVLTRSPDSLAEESAAAGATMEVATSLDAALDLIQDRDDIERVFIIGGAGLFADAMSSPDCERIYLTKVQTEVECDTFIPVLDESRFTPMPGHEVEAVTEGDISYEFHVYVQKKAIQ